MKEKLGLSDQCHVINAVLLSNPDYVASKCSPAFLTEKRRLTEIIDHLHVTNNNKKRENLYAVHLLRFLQ